VILIILLLLLVCLLALPVRARESLFNIAVVRANTRCYLCLRLCLEEQIVIVIFWITVASVRIIKPFLGLMRSRWVYLRWRCSYRVRYNVSLLIRVIETLTRDAENLVLEMFFLWFFLFRFGSGSIVAVEITEIVRIIAAR